MRLPGLLLAAAAALPGAAPADPGEWEVSAEVSAGLDGNATRAVAPEAAVRAPFLGLAVRARGAAGEGGLRGRVSLSEALRLHQGAPGADALASGLEAEGSAALGAGLTAGLSLAASDLRDEARRLARHELRAAGSLTLGTRRRGAALGGGWALFAPRDPVLRALTAEGPQASLRAHWSPAAGHALTLSGTAWQQDFPHWDPAERRQDTTFAGAAEYAYRGPFLAALGLEAARNRSRITGGGFTRQRLTGRVAAFLPLDVTLAGRVALQRSRYPAPLLLRDQLVLADGGEGQTLAELRLARRLGERWEVALAAAHHRSEAASGSSAPAFRRSTAALSLSWRAGSGESD
ncbi:MAG: hypothetical protein HZB56_15150 [Deltaproteobacteria bacterium]|nr:hypothetical protein [Deltaproteobacteria bacterium]